MLLPGNLNERFFELNWTMFYNALVNVWTVYSDWYGHFALKRFKISKHISLRYYCLLDLLMTEKCLNPRVLVRRPMLSLESVAVASRSIVFEETGAADPVKATHTLHTSWLTPLRSSWRIYSPVRRGCCCCWGMAPRARPKVTLE